MANIISVRELINIFPLDQDLKKDLLLRYPDHMDDTEKRLLQEVIWGIYDRYFTILLNKNIDEAMVDIGSGDLEARKDLRLQMQHKTEDEILDWIVKNVDKQEIQEIQSEIEDSKTL